MFDPLLDAYLDVKAQEKADELSNRDDPSNREDPSVIPVSPLKGLEQVANDAMVGTLGLVANGLNKLADWLEPREPAGVATPAPSQTGPNMQTPIDPTIIFNEFIRDRPQYAIASYFFEGFSMLTRYPAPGRARFVYPIRDCEIEVFSHFEGSIQLRFLVLSKPIEPCECIWTPFQMLYDVSRVVKGAWPEFGKYPWPIARLPMEHFMNMRRVTSPETRELPSIKQTLRKWFPTFDPELVKDRLPDLNSEPLCSLIVPSREQRTLPSDARFLMRRNAEMTFPEPNEPDLYIDIRGKVQIQLPSEMRGEEFSEGLAIVHGKGIGCDVIDISGKTVLHLPYQRVERFSDGYAGVANGNKWGFIDKQGEVRIPFIFDSCTDFTNGLAAARKGGDEWFLIDKMGRTVGRVKMDLPCALGGEFLPARINNLFGFLNRVGEIVIEPRFSSAEPFSGGLARVEIDGKYGFIDESGELVIPAEFYSVKSFSEGLAVVVRHLTETNFVYGFINSGGNVKIPLRFGNASSFSEGLALVESADHGQEIYIDRDGNPSVVPMVKQSLRSFDNGLAAYTALDPEARELRMGFINRAGQVVAGPTFTHVEKFRDGLSKVWLSKSSRYSDGRGYEHQAHVASMGYVDGTGGYVYNLTLVEDTDKAEEPEWSKAGFDSPEAAAGYDDD